MSHLGRLLSFLLVLGGSVGCGAPYASDDFCNSQQFREAFLDGQRGVIIDYTNPGPELISFGDRALPCLTRIVQQGGGAFGIEGCLGGPGGCSGWALGAIRMIGTSDARAYLLDYLNSALDDPKKVEDAIEMLGSLQDPTARPRLLEFLKHPSPAVRAQCIVSLGAIGDPADYEAMLETAIALPDDELYRGVHGMRILGDERALDALQSRIAKIDDATIRSTLERTHESWRAAIQEEDRIVNALRTESGLDLYKTIQELKTGPRSPAIREALIPLLEHEDGRTRAASVEAISRFNMATDFDKLLEVTLGLPSEYVLIAAKCIEQFNDPRAIEPLQEYAAAMKNSQRRRELSAIADRIRQRTTVAERR